VAGSGDGALFGIDAMAHEDRSSACKAPGTAPDVTGPPSDTAVASEPVDHRAAPHDRPPPQVGSTVKHYELLRKLGQGAMGTVYLARDTTLGRLVAVKVLRIHTGPSTERFLIEAQATARCRHDNIVVIHEVDDLHGYPYMVLEYLEGRTLREWIAQRDRPAVSDPAADGDARSGLVSPSLAIELLLPVVRALACAHQLGIVHRDLKPENIFLTCGGRVVVLDFGIAKRLEPSELSAIDAAAWPHDPGAELTQDEEASPFAGLAAFQEEDTERFMGREREILSLIGRLRNQPLLMVAGPSGAGKSSCVWAGVIPALKRSGERWEAMIVRPGRRPLAALADLLAQIAPVTGEDLHTTAVEASAPDPSSPDVLPGAFHTQPGLVGARLRAHCRRAGGRQRILLYVDQFEELYTLCADAAERAAFVACLEGVADDASSPLRVMLSIRSDFLDRMAEERHFLAEVTRALFFLRPMGRDGLRDALTRPLLAAGYRFDNDDMVQAMLGGLEHTKSPLPLLQFTAAKLWEARDRTSRLLTQASYDQLGGVAGALSAHANAVLAALSPADQRLCRAVLLRLCTPERTRAVVSLSDLHALAADRGAVEQVVHRLSDARLVLVEAGGEREGTTVELCHESLIDSWDKFQQWLSESEQDTQFVARLYAAARQWEASQEAEGLLWRDRAAREAADWLARRRTELRAGEPIGLGPREERFLFAVIALSERMRRRRQRIFAGGLATVCVIAAVVLILSIGVKRQAARADQAAGRAEQEALSAQNEARQARNATRMAAARELDPEIRRPCSRCSARSSHPVCRGAGPSS